MKNKPSQTDAKGVYKLQGRTLHLKKINLNLRIEVYEFVVLLQKYVVDYIRRTFLPDFQLKQFEDKETSLYVGMGVIKFLFTKNNFPESENYGMYYVETMLRQFIQEDVNWFDPDKIAEDDAKYLELQTVAMRIIHDFFVITGTVKKGLET